MGFQLINGHLVINDTNYRDQIGDGTSVLFDGHHRMLSSHRRKSAHGSLPFAAPPSFQLIPRSEWSGRIKRMEETKTRLSDICDRAGVKCLNQMQTSYCHANSAAGSLMALRAFMNEPTLDLSPGSVGGPVTGYRNAGAAIEDDLAQIVKGGCATTQYVDANETTREGWREGAVENAMKHRCTQWWDLGGHQMFDQVATLLLSRLPVATGLNWWGHSVLYYDLVEISPRVYGVRFRNSWGEKYGTRGYAVLQEGKGTPDQAYSPGAETPSLN